MIAAGFWQPRKGAKVCVHPMRERRACLGELIQIDGSPHDAHLPYQGTAEERTRTLSAQVIKTLSKNLSCQHQGELIQVVTSGTGLAMRGAAVTLHQHFDGTQELRWRKRKLIYTAITKAQRQAAEADSKAVNERVDKALAKRCNTNKGTNQQRIPLEKHAHRQVRHRGV